MKENWVVEIGWWMRRIETAGDICLRRPRLTQGCKANDDDDDDDDDDDMYQKKSSKIVLIEKVLSVLPML